MKVTVVIPNFNGYKFLEKCLNSLENQSYKDFRTIIIDNASIDESCKFITENYPWVDLIRLNQNYGFCGAVNRGIEETSTPYIILLNNDTEVEKSFVEELINSIEKDEKIFSCSSKMINFNSREIMDDAGDLYSVIGWAFQRGVGQPIDKYNTPKKIFSACAGAAIYRMSIFAEIGNFDENHFAYLEDVDIGYRAKIYGYKNIYSHKAIVYHVGSGTTGSKYNEFKVRHTARNSIYLIQKNMPLPFMIINSLPIFAGILIKYFFFKKKGLSKEYLSGIKEGFRNSHKLKKIKLKKSNLICFLSIEIEICINSLIFIKEHIKRKYY